MEPPKPRKKREASMKNKEKGHAYSARHTRIALEKACKSHTVPQGAVLANGTST